MNKPYQSFAHGLVKSKIWLCDELENILTPRITAPTVNILGSWHNTLAFMMIVRKPNYYAEFNAYDVDSEATDVANKICDTWLYESPKVYNHTIDANTIAFTYDSNTVYINCSVDQFEDTGWYTNIPTGSIVCLQSTNMPLDNDKWHISQSVTSLEELQARYQMTTLLYSGSLAIDYHAWGYTRFMLIGIK